MGIEREQPDPKATQCRLYDIHCKKEKVRNIAIMGAGVAGMVQAIAFLKKLGSSVRVHLFEQHPFFDLSKGVELSVGPEFQMVMQALGCDMRPELERYGYPHFDASVRDSLGNVLVGVEEEIRRAEIYTKRSVFDGRKRQMLSFYPYSINRGVFMELLQKVLSAVGGSISWGYKLESVRSEGGQKTLYFKNGQSFKGFDLVVGADGIHSRVRECCFDSDKARHVGANILYGIIPDSVAFFDRDKFNIICSERFTTVSCCYKERDGALSTWWAIVYPDQNRSHSQEYRAFWETQTNVQAIAKALVEQEPGSTYAKRYVEQTQEFKYAGVFLERDPLTLPQWGKEGVVLIGDAVHAMQPWAGVGASLAAEDAYVLAEWVKRKGFEQLQSAFDGFQNQRLNRILYFRQVTLNNTPQGILPAELYHSTESVVARYGNQRALAACPAWQELLNQNERDCSHQKSPVISCKL